MTTLQNENEDLQRALQAVEKHLETALLEKDQISALYEDFRGHYESIKGQVSQYQKRLGEEIQIRKETELNLEGRLNDMKRLMDLKQREIDQMAQKLSLPVDTDILRMKIQKDLESRHRIDLEQ